MKRLIIMLAVSAGMLGTTTSNTAAQQNEEKHFSEMESYKLEISDAKTSNIIFPFAIVSVDRGSKDILVQKAKGVEHILQVKAAKENFETSNLSVVTADGKLTTIIVSYAKDPSSLQLSLSSVKAKTESSIFVPKENINEEEVRSAAAKVLASRTASPDLKDDKNDIVLHLQGIFIKDNVLYFRFAVSNWSNVGYDVEQLRFFIRDQKKANRTASQEIEVVPLYTSKTPDKIPGKTIDKYVFALPKFTIPDKKYMTIQLMEKDGGRHLVLKVKNRHILKAEVIKL